MPHTAKRMKSTEHNIRTAVILAAGRGSRLCSLTRHRPKCLVEVAGMSLLERMLWRLRAFGIETVVIVVGYRADAIEQTIGREFCGMTIIFIMNERWEHSNNVLSLQLAVPSLNSDFLLLESDLMFDREALLPFGNGGNAMAVDRYQPYMDGTVVRLDGRDAVEAMYLKHDTNRPDDLSGLYKTVNIYSFKLADFRDVIHPLLCGILEEGLLQAYYELAFARAIARGLLEIRAVQFQGVTWAEIDDEEDFNRAVRLFPPEHGDL